MQPSVQCGSSMGAIGVPYAPTTSRSYSHSSRPQPYVLPTSLMVLTNAWYSG